MACVAWRTCRVASVRAARGSANLSVQTMVKLAQAVGATLEPGLAE